MAVAMARARPRSTSRRLLLRMRARRRRHCLKSHPGELCVCRNLLYQIICALSEWTESMSTIKRLAVARPSWTTDIPNCLLMVGRLHDLGILLFRAKDGNSMNLSAAQQMTDSGQRHADKPANAAKATSAEEDSPSPPVGHSPGTQA